MDMALRFIKIAHAYMVFLQQQNIDVLSWPSKSLDFNSIEHI
jgi:hypothetical protein